MSRYISIFLILFYLSGNGIIAQTKEDRNGNLVGKLEKIDFLQGKFKSWFEPEYKEYQPSKSALKKIRKNIDGISIKVFMGTWCHDSHREIPRFYKIMEAVEMNVENIEVIGLTRGKRTPDDLQEGYNIKNTPSFIFYKGEKEIGRYIEQPRKSMEKDFLKIITGKPYKHTYQK